MSTSCSKKSDPAPAPVLSCVVTKRVVTTSDRVVTSIFTYDDQQRLIKVEETYVTVIPAGTPTTTGTFTYTYSGSSVASVKTEFSSTASSFVSTWTNADGKLTKIDVSGDNTETITFTYDTQGRFKSSSLTSTGASVATQATYTAGGGAPVSISTSISIPVIALTTTDMFTATSVDAKQNPYALLAKAINQPNYYDGFEGGIFVEFLTTGNPLKVTRVTSTNGSTNTNEWTYTYEYNAKNYPTKVTGSLAGSSFQTVTTFEYSNCN